MTLRSRHYFDLGIITAALGTAVAYAVAQGLQPGGAPVRPSMAGQSAAPNSLSAKPSAQVPATAQQPLTHGSSAHSLLDEPATPAQIQLSGDELTIRATNASLSGIIRQVASNTGMQVEGDSHDQRVFGSYGPGSAPDVLSALLYDSGYNVIMVGKTADGAPRRLVLSLRTAGSVPQASTAAARSTEDDEEEAPVEVPPPQPNPTLQPVPGSPLPPGQPKTPQQMLEELQRMHQAQQPPADAPKD